MCIHSTVDGHMCFFFPQVETITNRFLGLMIFESSSIFSLKHTVMKWLHNSINVDRGRFFLNMPHSVTVHWVNKPLSAVRARPPTLNQFLLTRSLPLVPNSWVTEEQPNTKGNTHLKREDEAPSQNGKKHTDIKSPNEICFTQVTALW